MIPASRALQTNKSRGPKRFQWTKKHRSGASTTGEDRTWHCNNKEAKW